MSWSHGIVSRQYARLILAKCHLYSQVCNSFDVAATAMLPSVYAPLYMTFLVLVYAAGVCLGTSARWWVYGSCNTDRMQHCIVISSIPHASIELGGRLLTCSYHVSFGGLWCSPYSVEFLYILSTLLLSCRSIYVHKSLYLVWLFVLICSPFWIPNIFKASLSKASKQ